MPEHRPGRTRTASAPEHIAEPAGAGRHRLARLLAEMVPGARTLRITLREPARNWPSAHASAYDARGHRILLNRPRARTEARWITRACPEADSGQDNVLDLTTGKLLRAAGPRLVASGDR